LFPEPGRATFLHAVNDDLSRVVDVVAEFSSTPGEAGNMVVAVERWSRTSG